MCCCNDRALAAWTDGEVFAVPDDNDSRDVAPPRASSLRRSPEEEPKEVSFSCPGCSRVFAEEDHRWSHWCWQGTEKQGKPKIPCRDYLDETTRKEVYDDIKREEAASVDHHHHHHRLRTRAPRRWSHSR